MGKYIKYFDNANTFWDSEFSLDDDKPFVGMVGTDMIVYSPSLYIDDAGHSYVDLGLPSKNLWATSDLSGYFYWGESISATDKHAYTYGTSGNMIKYNNSDNLFTLQLEDDTAHNLWGGNWIIPTHSDWEELFNYTTKTTTNNGRKFIFTSNINGNSIEISWIGHWWINSLNGLASYEYRMTSDRPDNGTDINMYTVKLDNSTSAIVTYSRREYGLPIRPVIHQDRKWYNRPAIFLNDPIPLEIK